MSDAFVQLPLIRLVDLAISTEGNVNFHLLQALLHALIQKSSSQAVAIEIHGSEATKIQEQLKAAPEKQTYSIKETVDKSDQGKDQIIYVLQPETAYQGSSSVAKEKVDCLETEVEELKKQITELRDLPGNLGIIDAVKNYDEKTSTVIDVFHMLALAKRIEAVEEGMVKIASIVEDLIKSPGALTMDTKNVVCQKEEDASSESTHKRESKDSKISKISKSGTWTDEGSQKRGTGQTGTGGTGTDTGGTDLTGRVKTLEKEMEEIQGRLKMKKKSAESVGSAPHAAESVRAPAATNASIREMVGAEEETYPGVDMQIPPEMSEERLKELIEHVERLDLTFNEEITRLHNQFTDIEKDFNDLLNKYEMGGAGGDSDEPNACCNALYQRMVQLEADFTEIHDTSTKLLDDKEDKSKILEMLVEQVEVLKSVKADREELEEALADKADACAVLRKVSHDQFDNAYDELSKGVSEALEKLGQQELLWQQALEDIQNDIGNKLDKMDLGPLRDFINSKLRQLQDKMKSLADLKREQEAAGTKNKLLRDVTCISCDKDVVMQREYDLSMRPMPAVIPPTRSMAPYLAYELDALRKQQKAIPGGKNLFSFEAAMQGRVLKKSDDHLCNRYCGGSHTITTPHQRVTRLGHFLMQWGPEAQPAPPIEKRGSAVEQTLSAEKPQEGGGSLQKVPSKTDSKHASKISRQSKEVEVKKEASASEARKSASKTPKASSSKKISVTSQSSGMRVKSQSKSKQMTISEEHESGESHVGSKISLQGEGTSSKQISKTPSPTPVHTEGAEAEESNEGEIDTDEAHSVAEEELVD